MKKLLPYLALALLTACSGHERALKDEDPEKQAIANFADFCIATAGDVKKIGRKFASKAYRPLTARMTRTQLESIPGQGALKQGWILENPVSHAHYSITVSEHGTCNLTAENLRRGTLQEGFNVVLEEMGKTSGSQPRHTSANNKAAGLQGDFYHFQMKGSATGPTLGIVTPVDAGDSDAVKATMTLMPHTK